MKRWKIIRRMRRRHVKAARWFEKIRERTEAYVDTFLWTEYPNQHESIPKWVDSWKMDAKLKKLRKRKEVILIIAGSRSIPPKKAMRLIKAHWKKMKRELGIKPTRILSGGAPGVDTAAIMVALELTKRGALIMPADWKKYGRGAGPIRNVGMAQRAHALFLLWDGKSKGSKHMLGIMHARNKPVYEVVIEDENA